MDDTTNQNAISPCTNIDKCGNVCTGECQTKEPLSMDEGIKVLQKHMDVELIKTSKHIKVGVYMRIDTEKVKEFLARKEDSEEEVEIKEVCLLINGAEKVMTLDEFMQKIGV